MNISNTQLQIIDDYWIIKNVLTIIMSCEYAINSKNRKFWEGSYLNGYSSCFISTYYFL